MSLRLFMLGLCLLVAAGAVFAQTPDPRAVPVPGLSYGNLERLPLPKTILFSAGPEEILANAEAWKVAGVSAFFLDFVARDWSSDIWARDGEPWTIGESDKTLQATRAANEKCRAIGSETFLKIAFDHHFEWFNDLQWETIYHNFRQFSVFAREAGCTGIALDIEYVGEQYDFGWPGYDYDAYTRAELVSAVRERMTECMEILLDDFPEMVFLTFPEQGLTLGQVIHVAWLEEMARRGAPGGFHYCTEYTYRNPNINYMFGHAWAVNDILQRLLSERGQRYWREHGSIAEGIWPFGENYQTTHEPGMPLDAFRQGYAASLMASARYNWIYSHQSAVQLLGRELDKYTGDADLPAYLDIIRAREVATDPQYVALAEDLRSLKLRDYSPELGVIPVPSFVGPTDVPKIELVPADQYAADTRERMWTVAQRYFAGEELNLKEEFGTVTDWLIIGPFPSDEQFAGHNAVYPPEQELKLDATYDGGFSDVRWQEYHGADGKASVDLKAALEPGENVCAYALCYVTTPEETQAQVRIGTNDSGKVWLNGRQIFDYPGESGMILDRNVVPVTLPAGTSPVLVKVCNGLLNWGFVFRLTGLEGEPLEGVAFSLRP